MAILCPCSEESLLAMSRGEEPEAELREHVSSCPTCQGRLNALLSISGVSNVPAPTESVTQPDLARRGLIGAGHASIGKYVIIGKLGQGGQGQVFRALHPELNKELVIKLAGAAVPGQDAESDLLMREGRVLAELEHPGIGRVYDLGIHDGQAYLVMEYVRGVTLKQHAEGGRLSPRQAAAIIAPVARALAAAHRRGVIHQDVKPANILIDEAGRPRLIDFGLARLRGAWNAELPQPTGGTAAFMAPEQARDEAHEVGSRSDIFALGAVFYSLLTGRPPFSGPSWSAALDKAATCDFDRGALQKAAVPPRLAAICLKAMSARPGERQGDADELADELEDFLRRPQRIRRVLAGVAASLLLAALAWGAITLLKTRPDTGANPIDASLSVVLLRGDQRLALKTIDDWERALPLREQDRLKLAGTVPAGMKVALFAVTLSDLPALKVTALEPVVINGNQFRLDGVAPLEASPATELLVACASPGGAPTQEQITALLGKLPSVVGAPKTAWKLPDDIVVPFNSDGINESRNLSRVGKVERDPIHQTINRVDEVRNALRESFPFVMGVVFTHVPRDVGAAKRGETVSGQSKLSPEESGGSEEDRKLFRDVMDRLLQTDLVRRSYPAQAVWPPRAYIQPRSARTFNAFAGPMGRDKSGKTLFRAFITEGYMNKIIQGDADVLAAVMGHELAHVTRGHLASKISIDLAGFAFSRDQEFEADLEGVKIAVAAGFPYKSGVKSAFREWKVLGDRSSFEALASTHPTWTDRLQILEKKQAEIWKSMSAFQNGYFFLHAEQYRTAETCFESVVDEFPDCAEAWANLGYARLMQYCDGLDEKDLRRYGIGPFVAGCFYARPQGLVPDRGIVKETWQRAVDALKMAIKKDAGLVLPQANLGLAYLVYYDPDEKMTDEALAYFRKAFNLKDKGLDGLNLAAFLVNFGVAEQAAGLQRESAEKFRLARKLLAEVKGSPLRTQLNVGLLYNEALQAAAGKPEDRARAFAGFEEYLKLASPDSAWWKLAYERYEKLAGKLGRQPLSCDMLRKRLGANLWRVVSSLDIGGKVVTLGESAGDVRKKLGRDEVGVPIFHRSKVKRFNAAAGVDLLADHRILAIFLTSEQAPPLVVQARGVGSKKYELRVGMTAREFLDIVHDQPVETGYLDRPSVRFVFLPTMGIGVRVDDGRIGQLVLAQVPRKQTF